MYGIGIGDLKVLAFNGKCWNKRTMKNALYVPKLYANLFSSTKAYDNGHTSQADSQEFILLDGDTVVAVGVQRGNMYKMLNKVIEPTVEDSMANVAVANNSLHRVWHERLGHQNLVYVRSFLKSNNIDFIDENFDCDGCAYGKQHRLSFSLRVEKSTECSEIPC